MITIIRYIYLLPLLLLISCGRNLNEKEAEKHIVDLGIYPTERFEGFRLNYNPKDSDSYFYKNHKMLFTLGILQNLKTKNKEDSTLIDVSLTDKGREYLNKRNPYNSDSTAVFLNLSTIHFIRVDSVITSLDYKNASVYAKFKETAITPIGKYVFAVHENMYTTGHFDFEKRNGKWLLIF